MRWYLRYSLLFRDVKELLRERGLEVDHTRIWRWVQRDGPALEGRLRCYLKPTHTSWRVDETDVRIKGRWCDLYRALDSSGDTTDVVLSGLRDTATAERLFRKALTDPSHPQPRVINTDQARCYDSAISGVKKRKESCDTVAAAATHGARVVVPPTKAASVSRRGSRSSARDRTITRGRVLGRRRWKKASGDHRQARVENTIFRYKSIIGGARRARTAAGRQTEAWLGCQILNQMTELGRPASYRMGA